MLIVTPTRELAEQIDETIKVLAQFTQIRSAPVYGGVGMPAQTQALRRGTDIIVACPGRLLDHAQQGHVNFGGITHLVLDEGDRMFDMGFLPNVQRIVAMLPVERQTMLFSATFPPEVEQLARSVLRKPQRIKVGNTKPATTITHALYPVPGHLKAPLLLALLKDTNAYAMLVFTRTKHRADRLTKILTKEGVTAVPLHGDRTQSQRQRALEGFKAGKFQVLVATDLAARGLDIETISHVINYDVPGTPEDYIHRIGRTGRAERTGDAFTLVTGEDYSLVKDIERALGAPISRKTLESFDYKAAPAPGTPPEPPQRQQQQRQQQRPQQPGQWRGQPQRDDARRPQRGPAPAPAVRGSFQTIGVAGRAPAYVGGARPDAGGQQNSGGAAGSRPSSGGYQGNGGRPGGGGYQGAGRTTAGGYQSSGHQGQSSGARPNGPSKGPLRQQRRGTR